MPHHSRSSKHQHWKVVPAAFGLVVIALFGSPVLASGGPSVDLDTVVSRTYFDGVPLGEAQSYGPEAVPRLAELLRDPSKEGSWGNIVVTLGAIGDASGAEVLLDFLKDLHGEVPVTTFRAALLTMPALGHIARGGSPIAMAALAQYSRPDGRTQETLRFSFQRYRAGQLGEVLGRMAILGLGFIPSVEARSVLRGIRRNPAMRTDWNDNVSEALALSVRIQKEGADRVFRMGRYQ